MSDPWSINYFDPPAPKVGPPPKPKVPKLIPDEDRLFQAQRNALKVLNNLQNLELELKGKDIGRARATLQALEKDAENTYRVIRTYLNKHVNPQQP